MADGKGPSTDGQKVDLNDPNTRMDRASAMAQMAASRRESVKADMGDDDRAAFEASLTTESAAEDAEDPVAAAAVAAARAANEVHADPIVDKSMSQLERQRNEPIVLSDEDLSKYTVRTKVNGVERDVTLADLRASAQKNDAADEFLVRAKRTLAEVNAVAAQIKEAAAGTAPPNKDTPSDTSAEDPLKLALTNLFSGDEAKAEEMFRKWKQADSPTSDAAMESMFQKFVIRNALQKFAQDHKEIAADPALRMKADGFLNEDLREVGVESLEQLTATQIPEFISRAGTRTNAWLKELAGVPAQREAAAPKNSMDDKRQRKAGIDELPAAATRSMSTTPVPRTASQTIAEMAAKRNPMSSTSG